MEFFLFVLRTILLFIKVFYTKVCFVLSFVKKLSLATANALITGPFAKVLLKLSFTFHSVTCSF